jgi:hypothetical protein
LFFIIINWQKEGFTELYFKDAPPKSTIKNGNSEFSFVIHNREFVEKNYLYEAHIESKLLKKGYVTLNHNESLEIHCTITINEVPDRELYIVAVTVNEEKSIHFWIQLK